MLLTIPGTLIFAGLLVGVELVLLLLWERYWVRKQTLIDEWLDGPVTAEKLYETGFDPVNRQDWPDDYVKVHPQDAAAVLRVHSDYDQKEFYVDAWPYRPIRDMRHLIELCRILGLPAERCRKVPAWWSSKA